MTWRLSTIQLKDYIKPFARIFKRRSLVVPRAFVQSHTVPDDCRQSSSAHLDVTGLCVVAGRYRKCCRDGLISSDQS